MTDSENGRSHPLPLIEVNNLKKHFPIRQGILKRQVGTVRAVDGISFKIYKGETLGLVGESGCGKSSAGKTILQLHRPTEGSVFFEGESLTKLNREQLRRVRRHMQLFFQDPYSSLDPRMTVGNIISEPLVIHNIGDAPSQKERVEALLSLVGLNPYFVNRYPHEFSGGQRQRIGIARALATNPSFVVADDPISALDASIQAQIVNLLADLKQELDLTYLFIAQELWAVRDICDRVAIMYSGKIAEIGECDALLNQPLHPYTQTLLATVPLPDADTAKKRPHIVLDEDTPTPAGCRFHPRCMYATDICRQEEPILRPLGNPKQEHMVACHHAEGFLNPV
ncbi:ABC transporter ATP-binding protein [Candidatus Leptofilum sp.]|uniref:ABC transporter ATP-binding protein n=1 Tax=Candidatus Leptofilum sp. TaxID=3241576 RepID=UPI003B59DCF1